MVPTRFLPVRTDRILRLSFFTGSPGDSRMILDNRFRLLQYSLFCCSSPGLPSLTTDYFIFSRLSPSQPLTVLFQRYSSHFLLLSALPLHVQTGLLGAGPGSSRGKVRRLPAAPQSEVSRWNTHVLWAGTVWAVVSRSLAPRQTVAFPASPLTFQSRSAPSLPRFPYWSLFLWVLRLLSQRRNKKSDFSLSRSIDT